MAGLPPVAHPPGCTGAAGKVNQIQHPLTRHPDARMHVTYPVIALLHAIVPPSVNRPAMNDA